MPDSAAIDPRTRPLFDELVAVTGRYLQDGLDPALVMCAIAGAAIRTAQADPQYKQMYLDYFAEALRGMADVTITDE